MCVCAHGENCNKFSSTFRIYRSALCANSLIKTFVFEGEGGRGDVSPEREKVRETCEASGTQEVVSKCDRSSLRCQGSGG